MGQRKQHILICQECGKEVLTSAKLYCSKQCTARVNGRAASRVIRVTPAKFWDRIRKTSEDGCWLWQGTRNNKGYGLFGSQPRTLAHRYAYVLTYGEIVPGWMVLHRCDTPLCCNPSHLFLGTQQDNMKDASVKNRIAHGLAQPGARLTPEIVEACRAQYQPRKVTYKQLADIYGVSASAISLALRGHTWRRAGGVGKQGQLTQEQNSLLRQMRSETGASINSLADHFHISTSSVHRIIRKGIPREEVRSRYKLTESDVVAIRTIYQGGKHSCIAVAELYGVSSSLISQIVNRKIWKHL